MARKAKEYVKFTSVTIEIASNKKKQISHLFYLCYKFIHVIFCIHKLTYLLITWNIKLAILAFVYTSLYNKGT